MRTLILGGDGFIGWPTALELSAAGHDVVIVDNLSRRRIDTELGVGSLTPIRPIEERIAAWREVTGREIRFAPCDVAQDFDRLVDILLREEPDAVVHLAEQRAAPYSMKSAATKRYTVDNNVNATHNLLAAIVESGVDPHVVHMGTMGVYGYGTAGVALPEGYLTVTTEGATGEPVSQEILYPTSPGSVYHMTKSLDQLLFAFYNRVDRLRITDLHQGIVWGTQTSETRRDDRLVNRFDYDGDYGTVLNRFLVEGVVGHPLTVNGTGGQTRAFIHIQNSVQCIRLAVEHPVAAGERVRIMNQMTETHRVRDLAAVVARITGATIQNVDNPRTEAAENELLVTNDHLLELGLEPIRLADGLLEEVTEIVRRNADRVDVSKIPSTSLWRRPSRLSAESVPR
ncbi:NAD-dependent epimerase/dehydratase family protein [Frondihabitans australicus]|uniref:UDP-sulfoquinovose synthase n=1 Tax=Frondihabitans australicus TaxID=386892 RepID=A0A495IBG7_9MICO|nr:NAD-dependent epimerase/dehydratase family protein [Frondihabitans australicus]RKR73344.1 UDP-sulfoquinovose synthase [Frondihabitans australicus]